MTGIERATPLYDYNQIMYRLDLDDPRLVLPLPVYERAGDRQAFAMNAPGEKIAFFAADRPREGLVAIGSAVAAGETLSVLPDAGQHKPIFYAVPADIDAAPPGTALLFAWRNADDHLWYGVEGTHGPAGYKQQKPLCRVWKSPFVIQFHP
jgi:hypothetical protein